MLQYSKLDYNSKFAEEEEQRNKAQQELNKINKRNLDRKKVYILNKHIFPSMANLILFFEYLAKDSGLKEMFEDDVKELFGYIKKSPDAEKREDEDDADYTMRNAILRRFLESIFLRLDFAKNPNDFRFDLLEEIYDIFTRCFYSILLSKNLGKIPNDITNSIELIGYLTKLHARNYKVENKKKILIKNQTVQLLLILRNKKSNKI